MAKRIGEVLESQKEGISVRNGDSFIFDRVRFGEFKYQGDMKAKVLFINTERIDEEPYTTSSAVIIDQVKEVIKSHASRGRDEEGREVWNMDEPFETTVKEERGSMGKYFVLT